MKFNRNLYGSRRLIARFTIEFQGCWWVPKIRHQYSPGILIYDNDIVFLYWKVLPSAERSFNKLVSWAMHACDLNKPGSFLVPLIYWPFLMFIIGISIIRPGLILPLPPALPPNVAIV